MDNSKTKVVPKMIDLRKDIMALSERCLHTFILKRIISLNIGNSWQNGLTSYVSSQLNDHPANVETLNSFLKNHSVNEVNIESLDITVLVPMLLYYQDFINLYSVGYDRLVTQQFVNRLYDFLYLRNTIRHYTEDIPESKRSDFILDQMDSVCTIIRFSLLCEKYCKNGYYWKDAIKRALYLQRIIRGEKSFLNNDDIKIDVSPNSNLCEIEMEAETGNTSAQTLLGKMLYEGTRYEKDYDKAFYWFYKAARKNDKEACYYVGKSYRDGLAVDFDYERGMKWVHKSADLGYPPAMEEVATLLFVNSSIQDKHELIEILNKLMAINYPSAFWLMGQCYKGGIGVEVDLQKTKELTEKAAMLGYEFAAEHLAETAIKNNDYETALKWLEIAASHNSTRSINKLKRFKETGRL